MLTKENVLFSVADHPTPKVDDSGIGYALNSRDYKDAQCVVLENHPADSRVKISKDGIVQTLSSRMGTGGNNTPMVMQNSSGEDISGTLDSNYFKGCGEREGTEREVVVCGEVAACLNAQDGRGGVHSQKMSDPEGNFVVETNPQCIGNEQTAQLGLSDKAHTLNCMHDQQAVMENLVVRRLTPLECSRLQGLPDGWLDIGEWKDENGKLRKDSDAPKYKCAGNGIATPFWYWLMKRISKQLKADGVETPTMASLFDGSGSFPLLWQYINGDGTAIWSSEIESYPTAVSERHLGENGDWQKFEKPKCLEGLDND